MVRRGDCPSVHRPFCEVDGALMRIRLPGGGMTVPAARAIGTAASQAGTGPVELTNRANLQLRAVPVDAIDQLRDALVAAGAALADAAADERRNVMTSPTAGVDPTELIDPRPLVAAIAARLADPVAAGLSPKFGVLVDGGGAVHLRGRVHDLVLGARRAVDGRVVYEVRVADALPRVTGGPAPVTVVEPDHALDLVGAVVEACRPYGRGSAHVEALGDVGAWADIDRRASGVRSWSLLTALGPTHAASESVVGVRPEVSPDSVSVGVGVLLGRLDPRTLTTVAQIAEDVGVSEVRVSPWRNLVLVGVPRTEAADVLARLERLGLVGDPAHPANTVVACAGVGGCVEARADVRADAARVIERLAAAPRSDAFAPSVHVSGCDRGCARATPADLTLVAVDGGSYDVFDGRLAAAGSDHPRFGVRVDRGLSSELAVDSVVSPVGAR